MGRRSKKLKSQQRQAAYVEESYKRNAREYVAQSFSKAQGYWEDLEVGKLDDVLEVFDALLENEEASGYWKKKEEMYDYVKQKVVRDFFNVYGDSDTDAAIRVYSDAQAKNLQESYEKETGIRLNFDEIKYGQHNELFNEYFEELGEGIKDKYERRALFSAFFGS